MQIDADSDGRVTWEELLTFLLQKDSGGDEEGNRFLPDVGYVPPPHSQQHTGQVTQLVAMPDKDKYLTLGRDGQMKAWQCGSLQHLRTTSLAEKGWAHDAVYSQASQRLVVATVHSRLTTYDSVNLRMQKQWRLPAVATALCIVEQPDVSPRWASCLLVGNKDGLISVYDWEGLQAGEALRPRLELHAHEEWIQKLGYSRDAGGLISSSDDGTLKVHSLGVRGDLRQRYCLRSPTGKPIMGFAYSTAHAAVSTCGLERHIHWWSLSIAGK